ncbi:MAG: PorP/SprF family type IX secretion system membrane protein [Saprospiraceae bacterium]|nr:PorP/SprF family type IX secretion system membrane protein [Saprospiraceae bacterium]
MKTKLNHLTATFVLGLIWLTFCSPIRSQDIHHSQFYTSPIHINPALTGMFNGDVRAAANYRNQWFVDELVEYLTFSGMVDMRFYPKKWTTKGIWSGGLLINYDRAGDSHLSLGHLGLSISYAYPISNNHIISLGALVGGAQRRFEQDKLTWNEQYVPNSGHNGNLPSGENFDNTSRGFLDLSGGINYRWQKSNRTKLDLGVGVFHLNKPEQKFFNQTANAKLPMRLSISLLPSFKIANKFDLLFHGLYQDQGPYQEIVLGGYGKFYLNTKRGSSFSLLLGAASRLRDAITPKIAAEINNWLVGFSYDVNTSPFKVATRRRGGPEFSVQYIFVKARPLSQLKACPIF